MGLRPTVWQGRGNETSLISVSVLHSEHPSRSDRDGSNVSAEIFVVCKDFLAPKTIDPKFLDPQHVFKEVSAAASTANTVAHNAQSNVFQPSKKRRHRDGYEDGDYTLFQKSGAGEFIRSHDPVGFLGTVNQIAFATDEELE
jgi:AdoMet-dependent rRNA methyltransferase SPB1